MSEPTLTSQVAADRAAAQRIVIIAVALGRCAFTVLATVAQTRCSDAADGRAVYRDR
jgi:hypothetical protein